MGGSCSRQRPAVGPTESGEHKTQQFADGPPLSAWSIVFRVEARATKDTSRLLDIDRIFMQNLLQNLPLCSSFSGSWRTGCRVAAEDGWFRTDRPPPSATMWELLLAVSSIGAQEAAWFA